MNHGFKLHPDGTLEITMPKGKKVGRVFVCEEGTQDGGLYYPDEEPEPILDKIRSEIGELYINLTYEENYRRGASWGLRRALEIINKYKSKSDIEKLPSAEPEPAIPLSWIEGQIKWLKSLDNAFSTLTAVQISAMVNKWKDEQNE